MPETKFVLTSEAVAAIRKVVQQVLGEKLFTLRQPDRSESFSPKMYVALTGSSGIPARSGTTAGSATVTLYKLPSGALESLGITATVYNFTGGTVAANAYIKVMQECASGELTVDVEDCGST